MPDGRFSFEKVERPNAADMIAFTTPITKTYYARLALDNVARVVIYRAVEPPKREKGKA
jgi:hypothetical protein